MSVALMPGTRTNSAASSAARPRGGPAPRKEADPVHSRYGRREGFDFLGCHLRKRMSGPIWERSRQRVYYLQRWPSQRAIVVIGDLTPVLRGWDSIAARATRPTTSPISICTSNAVFAT